MTETAVKAAVHRLRQRYGRLLREEIAETVTSEAEVDEELRHSCTSCARGRTARRDLFPPFRFLHLRAQNPRPDATRQRALTSPL